MRRRSATAPTVDVEDGLPGAGIEVTPGRTRQLVRVECARLAAVIRERRIRTVGLMPADDDVAVAPIAMEIGRALAGKNTRRIVVVDAHGTWPCAHALVERAESRESMFVTTWVLDNMAVLTPRVPQVGSMLEPLRYVLTAGALFDEVLVDLTAAEHAGEHLAAAHLLDGVTLVARSGRTKVRRIRQWMEELPQGHSLGVLLTGV